MKDDLYFGCFDTEAENRKEGLIMLACIMGGSMAFGSLLTTAVLVFFFVS